MYCDFYLSVPAISTPTHSLTHSRPVIGGHGGRSLVKC